ncbi:MAG: ATPase involved in chromosome partitioning [Pseudonocardiales bacterium]|nr:ATPase involved in chromosome partitioning [Pseudonocardiales bacterium]
MSSIAVLSAAGGAAWEARLLGDLGPDGNPHGVQIVRRCVDVVDLLAVAASGQGEAALVSATLRRLDADALERLAASAVAVVVVLEGDPEPPGDLGDGLGNSTGDGDDAASDTGEAVRLRALGVRHFVAGSARPEVVAAAIQSACADVAAGSGGASPRGFGLSTAVADPRMHDALTDPPLRPTHGDLGALVAVWGPTGGPGRSTVAATLADEIARLGLGALLIDGDVYGGSIATMLGLLDESPGVAAAARQAGNGRLDAPALAALCWAAEPGLRVLTGLPRADRWPELRPPALERMLEVSRSMADFTIVDVGFCLESDEELSFDTAAPRRNGATLAMLDAADVVIAVGAADPIGLTRLLRGLEDLKAAGVSAPVWIVLNRVRSTATRGPAQEELAAAVARFAGQPPAAYLPYDQSGVDAAMIAGLPIARVAPRSPFRSAVIELAIALTGAPRPDHGRRGARRAGARRSRPAGR